MMAEGELSAAFITGPEAAHRFEVFCHPFTAGEIWVGNPACEIGALMRLRHGRVLPETELTALEMAGWEHLAQAVMR